MITYDYIYRKIKPLVWEIGFNGNNDDEEEEEEEEEDHYKPLRWSKTFLESALIRLEEMRKKGLNAYLHDLSKDIDFNPKEEYIYRIRFKFENEADEALWIMKESN